MLEIKNLNKIYDDETDTLKNINLKVEDGQFTCIVGASGSGKSTLLKIIAGLDQPTSGEILLDGVPVKGPSGDRMVMFQESALFPWLSVIDNVKFGMKIAGVPKAEQEEKAMHYLKMVHLENYKDYAIHQLSGGMKQRVAFARALTMDSKMLLMDEPFSALDKQTTNHLRKELETIWEQTNKTVILITHSVEEAVFFADKVLLLSRKSHDIEKEIYIDLSRPRDIKSSEFLQYRSEILAWIEQDVDYSVEEPAHEKK